MKLCLSCSTEKSFDDFYADDSDCRSCKAKKALKLCTSCGHDTPILNSVFMNDKIICKPCYTIHRAQLIAEKRAEQAVSEALQRGREAKAVEARAKKIKPTEPSVRAQKAATAEERKQSRIAERQAMAEAREHKAKQKAIESQARTVTCTSCSEAHNERGVMFINDKIICKPCYTIKRSELIAQKQAEKSARNQARIEAMAQERERIAKQKEIESQARNQARIAERQSMGAENIVHVRTVTCTSCTQEHSERAVMFLGDKIICKICYSIARAQLIEKKQAEQTILEALQRVREAAGVEARAKKVKPTEPSVRAPKEAKERKAKPVTATKPAREKAPKLPKKKPGRAPSSALAEERAAIAARKQAREAARLAPSKVCNTCFIEKKRDQFLGTAGICRTCTNAKRRAETLLRNPTRKKKKIEWKAVYPIENGTKKCFTCLNVKLVSEFPKDIRNPEGIRRDCKVCEYQKRKSRQPPKVPKKKEKIWDGKMKTCCRCEETKKTNEFYYAVETKDNLRSCCIVCSKKERKNWYDNNLDIVRANSRRQNERKREQKKILQPKEIKN